MNSTDRKLTALFAAAPATGHDIAYALSLKGYTQRDVADRCDVAYQTVHEVIFSKGTSYNVASTISALLGVPMNRLWPDGRYSKPPRSPRVPAAKAACRRAVA
jgi:lambda repressor-like predicted transcriptional regulator